MLKLLFGKVTLKRIAFILGPGFIAGILLLWLHPHPSSLTWLSALLTVDLVSGMISNQLSDTHRAWQAKKPIYAYLFIIFHMAIYPVILFFIEKDSFIFTSLLMVLSIKLYGFIKGYFLS